MTLLHAVAGAVRAYRNHGFRAFTAKLVDRFGLPIPVSSRFRWKAGVQSEIRFWDDWFRTRGLRWPDSYRHKLDPDFPVQPRVAALLPVQAEVHLLDVGAGPLTSLGKRCDGKRVHIAAIDPLADEYDRLLEKHHIHPLVRTQKLDAEDLTSEFQANTFDLIYASNSVDHAYDPEEAIFQMIRVLKSGCYVLLEHAVNEAEKQDYSGMHQWNLSVSDAGDFMVRSRSREVNITRKYAGICAISCELLNGNTLITRIRKLKPVEADRGM